MSSLNLKDEVQKVMSAEWRGFSERHPRLAEVIDQSLLVSQATASIADDPEYQRVMREATGLEWSADVALELVRGFVRDFLRTLF